MHMPKLNPLLQLIVFVPLLGFSSSVMRSGRQCGKERTTVWLEQIQTLNRCTKDGLFEAGRMIEALVGSKR